MALLRSLDEVVAVVRAVELERTRQATDAGSRTLVGLAGAPGSESRPWGRRWSPG
ncbi:MULTISPECIES: hypothetical protein [unclassified Cryobacterium]|uniref:hypothetical protein n=1 Tax=unclassified Cryobacterium TaxID=2649013 RepID=UPI001304F0EA|nr:MULTISPECIES: hypothetical protein [unclassified Cryobacterium]